MEEDKKYKRRILRRKIGKGVKTTIGLYLLTNCIGYYSMKDHILATYVYQGKKEANELVQKIEDFLDKHYKKVLLPGLKMARDNYIENSKLKGI